MYLVRSLLLVRTGLHPCLQSRNSTAKFRVWRLFSSISVSPCLWRPIRARSAGLFPANASADEFACMFLLIYFLYSDYLRAVLRQNIAYFDRVGAGEVTNRVSHDVDLIQDGISDKVLPLSTFADYRWHCHCTRLEHSSPGLLSHTYAVGNSL